MCTLRDNNGMTESYEWVDDPDVPFKALLNYVETLPELVVDKSDEEKN